jgi:anti-anti-sigma factor
MTASEGFIKVEHRDETVILTPATSLGEIQYAGMEAEAAAVLDLLKGEKAGRVVIDLRHADYFGSSALGFFLRIWKRVCSVGGRLAMCHVSAHAKEILELTSLDRLWPICESRKQALAAVGRPTGGRG